MSQLVLTRTIVHAILEDDGKILLIREKDGTWYIPSGRVERHEDPIEALERETYEEAGIAVKATGLATITFTKKKFRRRSKRRKFEGRMHLVFTVEKVTKENKRKKIEKKHQKQVIDKKWVAMDKMSEENLRNDKLLEYVKTYLQLKQTNSILPIDALKIYKN